MGFLRLILGIIMGWTALRIVRSLMARQVGQRPEDVQLKTRRDSALQLTACPVCGVYTAMPCENCARKA